MGRFDPAPRLSYAVFDYRALADERSVEEAIHKNTTVFNLDRLLRKGSQRNLYRDGFYYNRRTLNTYSRWTNFTKYMKLSNVGWILYTIVQ